MEIFTKAMRRQAWEKFRLLREVIAEAAAKRSKDDKPELIIDLEPRKKKSKK